jgi:hypothetical protein
MPKATKDSKKPTTNAYQLCSTCGGSFHKQGVKRHETACQQKVQREAGASRYAQTLGLQQQSWAPGVVTSYDPLMLEVNAPAMPQDQSKFKSVDIPPFHLYGFVAFTPFILLTSGLNLYDLAPPTDGPFPFREDGMEVNVLHEGDTPSAASGELVFDRVER